MKKLFFVFAGMSALSVPAFAHSGSNNNNAPSCKSTDVGEMTFDESTNSVWICKSSGLIKIKMSSFEGEDGAKGATGAQGPAGAKGATGAQGPAGLMGPQGPAGAQGTAGIAGAKGATGAQGTAGIAGAKGATGAQGPAGLMGPQGLPGLNGAAGVAGANGADGAPGPMGPQGLEGPQGAPGLSALSQVPSIWSGGCDRHGGTEEGLDQSEYYCTSHVKFNSDPSTLEGAADGIGVVAKKTGYYKVRFWTLTRSDATDFNMHYIYGWITLNGTRVVAGEQDLSNHFWHNFDIEGIVEVTTAGHVLRVHLPAPQVTRRWYNDIEGWSGLQVQYLGPLAE